MTQEPDKTKTYAFSLYPDDAAVITSVAAEKFRYNTSEAIRHIVREYRDRHTTAEISEAQAAQ